MSEAVPSQVPLREITVEALEARRQQGDPVVIVDVREDDEVATGMIPGAIHIRLSDLQGRLAELPEAGDIYMICRGGGRSARACRLLSDNGRDNAISIAGGMEAWNARRGDHL